MTGAARVLLVVKVPAATHGTSDTRIARSLILASDLMPLAITPARNPCGAVTHCSISRNSSDKKITLLLLKKTRVYLHPCHIWLHCTMWPELITTLLCCRDAGGCVERWEPLWASFVAVSFNAITRHVFTIWGDTIMWREGRPQGSPLPILIHPRPYYSVKLHEASRAVILSAAKNLLARLTLHHHVDSSLRSE